MRKLLPIGIVTLAALTGCGLESLFSGATHQPYERPASTIQGAAYPGVAREQVAVIDGEGNALKPFMLDAGGAPPRYEIRLPSSTYSFLRVQARGGNTLWRALVPSVGEESAVGGVDLDARHLTEALIVEAWLSAKAKRFAHLNPPAYLGDGITTGTRTLIRRDLDTAGSPAQLLLAMVERLLTLSDPASTVLDPDFFYQPVLDGAVPWTVTGSPLDSGFLVRSPFDYDGDGVKESTTAKFDAQLATVAQLYQPDGCPDPARVRVLFTADFRPGGQDGNCGVVNRFKWATDKPGKQMFFVGWIHVDSPIQEPQWALPMGNGVPNTIPMYDDGTNGDEQASDGIWTLSVDLPRGLRVGYKYTWGFRGAPWTGSEEWPGNSRLLEVVDVGGDNFVYRRDVFGDEATNKDKMNLNGSLAGNVITWTTDLHGGQCGAPEVHEQKFADASMCQCAAAWHTPASVGPLTVACTGP